MGPVTTQKIEANWIPTENIAVLGHVRGCGDRPYSSFGNTFICTLTAKAIDEKCALWELYGDFRSAGGFSTCSASVSTEADILSEESLFQ